MRTDGVKYGMRVPAWLLTAVLLLLSAATARSQGIPPKPTDHNRVHDYAGVISDAEQAVMEDSLQTFAKVTSNEIAVVTVTTLDGMDKAYFAQQIGQTWGVGGKDNNNGIVILVKPKTAGEKGEAFIASGYGLEGALPDAFCSRIVNDKMIPLFKEEDYAGGIWAALKIIMPVARGEYSEVQYNHDADVDSLISALIFLAIFALFIFLAYKANKNGGTGIGGGRTYTGTGPIILGGGFGSGHSSWGSGSSWGGGPTWGGGSFGGGGGGGSW